MALQLDFTMDNNTFRHYLNGHCVVMHSHHYLALITSLMEELSRIDGPQILADVVEESMRELFDSYISNHGLSSPQERGNVGREYYSVLGLGKLVISGDENGGEVRISHSHIDEGWVRKWGRHDKPVNHFTRGYIAAMFAAAFDKPAGSYNVSEVAGIAAGAAEGRFAVRRQTPGGAVQ